MTKHFCDICGSEITEEYYLVYPPKKSPQGLLATVGDVEPTVICEYCELRYTELTNSPKLTKNKEKATTFSY